MNKKLRYFFIALSISAFIILAPLVVMFVTGVKIDLRNQEYQRTGIMVALSEPDDAEVFLNGEKQSNTPSTMRFLTQGEYNLVLKKEGYYDWSKNLAVEPNKITYNYEGVNAVQLIKLAQPTELPLNEVSSIVYTNGKLWYSSQGLVGWVSPKNGTYTTETIQLPFTPNTLITLNDDEFILATDTINNQALIDTRDKLATILPTGLNGSQTINVAPDGSVLALKDNVLYNFNPKTNKITALEKDLTGFTILGNTGYFATSNQTLTIDSRKWSNGVFGKAELLLETNPLNGPMQLLITKNKQLFAQIGSELYRVNQTLDLVSKQVDAITLDHQTNELTFTTPNELWFYNFISNKPQLLTRISDKTHKFLIRSEIGYGFIANQSGLYAWEIDNRSNQNRYSLFEQPSQSLALNHSISEIYALIEGKIFSTKIR